jgi:2,5-dihydroxypyridine 5,6-dioxygenase
MPLPTFTEMCRDELELCGIGDGSTVAVLSQGNQRADYVDAFLDAARELGAVRDNVR